MTVLGILPYLNVKPLIYPFENGSLPKGWSLISAPPAKLAEMLHDGRIAAAPISSFEVLGSDDLCAVPGICIASHGPVKSVVVLSRVPFERITKVALDSGSLSGAAMTKIILHEKFGIAPEYLPAEPNPSEMLRTADAVMLIGNAALTFSPVGLRRIDIGEAWLELTGYPAVFALWAGKKDLLTPAIARHLLKARDEGLKKIELIVNTESEKLGIPRPLVREYLSKNICYTFGESERASLEAFAELCRKHGLIPQNTGKVDFCNVG